jgi:hypothetical protein
MAVSASALPTRVLSLTFADRYATFGTRVYRGVQPTIQCPLASSDMHVRLTVTRAELGLRVRAMLSPV